LFEFFIWKRKIYETCWKEDSTVQQPDPNLSIARHTQSDHIDDRNQNNMHILEIHKFKIALKQISKQELFSVHWITCFLAANIAPIKDGLFGYLYDPKKCVFIRVIYMIALPYKQNPIHLAATVLNSKFMCGCLDPCAIIQWLRQNCANLNILHLSSEYM